MLAPQLDHFGQYVFYVADNRDIHFDAFGNAGRVNVDMNNFFGFFKEFGRYGNHAVIEARTDCQYNVCILHGEVGFVSAVHAQHTQELAVAGRVCAQAHQCAGTRSADHADEFGHFLRGIAQNHAAAEVNNRAFGGSQHLYGFFDLTDVALYNRLVRADEDVFLRIAEFSHCLGDIFRNIDNNGTRTAACGDLESFFDGVCQLSDIGYQEIVFDTRAGNADCIHFLECVCPDEGVAHLAADDY